MGAHEEYIDEIQQIELKYRATNKLRDLHIELLNEFILFYEWQLDVLKNESPKNRRNRREGKIINKKVDYYWAVYNIENYWN